MNSSNHLLSIIAETTYRISGHPVSGAKAFFWTVVIVLLWLGLRMLSGHYDRRRITDYLRQRGCMVKSITWDPLRLGWFGSRGERIYQVSYQTSQSKVVVATCKTSLFAGVYWADSPTRSDHLQAQALECLSCGQRIPSNRKKCSKCGWSYEPLQD